MRLSAFFYEMGDDYRERLDLNYASRKRWVQRGGDVLAFGGGDIRHAGDLCGMPVSGYCAALQASWPQAPAQTGQGAASDEGARP